MEQYFLWCHHCNSYTANHSLTCLNCNSTAVEQRLGDNSNSLQSLDASLTLLSDRLASLVQALQDLTNRVGSIPKKKPATEEMINSLEWMDFSSTECSICLDSQVKSMRKFPCGHLFHNDCLVKWLRIRRTCPSCRFELTDN